LAFVLAAGAFFLVLADLHSHRTAQVNRSVKAHEIQLVLMPYCLYGREALAIYSEAMAGSAEATATSAAIEY
jgi:hypothetical protein